jgi:hypothetical protein
VLEGEAAAGADLGLVAGRELDREAGRDQTRDLGLERDLLDGDEVHAGVLIGSMGIAGQDGVGVNALDADLHETFVMIAS